MTRAAWVVAMVAVSCGGPQSGGAGGGARVERTFDAADVARVEVRASLADKARVVHTARTDIRVAGTASGGVEGYHPADPNWKETPANEWGMTFEAERYGDLLVISTKNEMMHIHHHYYLSDLVIEAPESVEVELVTRELTGDGAPDLAER